MTPIDLIKDARGRYHSLLYRSDGVTVRLEGGSYNRIGVRVPHDIAHLIVEDAYGWEWGLWGVLACGGLVQNASFVAGRRPPHSAQRAHAIAKERSGALNLAELLVRAVADAMLEDDPRIVGARWAPRPEPPGAFERASTALRAAATRWNALPEGEALRLTWTLSSIRR
jgi:hypothetical protein